MISCVLCAPLRLVVHTLCVSQVRSPCSYSREYVAEEARHSIYDS